MSKDTFIIILANNATDVLVYTHMYHWTACICMHVCICTRPTLPSKSHEYHYVVDLGINIKVILVLDGKLGHHLYVIYWYIYIYIYMCM